MNADVILETRGLTKDFDGFVAVKDVDLRVRRGTIHAVIGPNGAGKTTLFNLLTGFLAPSAGSILLDGKDVTAEPPARIARRGVVRSFQMSAVFPNLTVRENVRVALQRDAVSSYRFWTSGRRLEGLDDRAHAVLAEVGLDAHGDVLAVELPYGRKRALELATTFALEPSLMLLDEPTQGMAHEEVGRVTALIRKVAEGRTVVMVEHNLSVVADLSDTITVMQRGRILAEGPYAEVSANPAVLEAYIGSAA